MGSTISADKLLYNCDSIADGTPVTADIFLNDMCNNRCTYCAYVRYRERGGNQIRIDDFMRYAKRLRELGVKGFLITGGGEPTICDDFDLIARFMEDEGIPYGITTNFNVYKEFSPRFLKVSLDAWDEDSYQAKRGVRAYNRTRDNVTRYLAWRDGHSPSTSVGLQMVMTDPEDILRFYEANADLDVDYFTFRPIESTCGSYYRDRENLDKVRDLVDTIESLRRNDSRVTFNFKWNYIQRCYDECYAHANQIAMNWNGEIMRCCHRPYDIIGHVMDDDILERNRVTRFDMSMCDVPCRMSSANELMQRLDAGCPDSEFLRWIVRDS